MTLTTVLLLFGIVIALLIAVNAIDQYKNKLAAERHQQLLQLAAVISETDELLINRIQLPMTVGLQAILLKRTINVIQKVLTMVPDSHSMPVRLKDAQEHLESLKGQASEMPSLKVANNDLHNAAMIKTIKKLRYILTKQKSKGIISAKEFATEDDILSLFLLRIFVEFKMLQGAGASEDKKYGSARQFYDKALRTLRAHAGHDDYTNAKEKEILNLQEGVTASIKEREIESPVGIDIEEDADDLELVFSDTKRKWDME